MEAYFLEVSWGRTRENKCESKFLCPETYIRRLSYEEKRGRGDCSGRWKYGTYRKKQRQTSVASHS